MRIFIALVLLIAFSVVSFMIRDLYGLIARTNRRYTKLTETLEPYIPSIVDGFKLYPDR